MVEGFLHHLAIFTTYKNRVLTPLKTIKIGREPSKTEFFECSLRSPRDRPEISNLWRFHAHFWFGWTAGICIFLGFYAFLLKSAFEPITTPLKWVLTDRAWKVSVTVFPMGSYGAGKCPLVKNCWFFLVSFDFSKFSTVGGAKTLPPSVYLEIDVSRFTFVAVSALSTSERLINEGGGAPKARAPRN